MNALFLCFVLGVVFLVSFLGGFMLARSILVTHCDEYGGFEYKGRHYRVIQRFRIDGLFEGLPDALKDLPQGLSPLASRSPPFAEGTLNKIKVIKPDHAEDLQKRDAPVEKRQFFHDKSFGCVQYYKNAGLPQNKMVLCPECGNKRCAKAQNHRYQCTKSNDAFQQYHIDKDSASRRVCGTKIDPMKDLFS